MRTSIVNGCSKFREFLDNLRQMRKEIEQETITKGVQNDDSKRVEKSTK
jgi:hypothetical protein